MSSPIDRAALLDRLDGELADLGARLSRVRDDLGALRPPAASSPTTGAERAPAPPAPPPPGAAPAGLGPWSPWAQPSGSFGSPIGPLSPVGPGSPWAPRATTPPSRPSSAPPSPPRPSRAALLVSRLTGARLLAIAGGGVTLVGVVLLLVLAASRGWFGPEARVVLGAVVGLALVGAGVRLQARRAAAAADGTVPAADPGPITLAATGITALYLTVAAAASLYAFLPVPVALVLALLVAGGGLVLADRWRRHGLALGVVVGAGLLLPLVVESAGALLVALFVVLVVVTLPIAARRGWSSLVLVAVAAASLAGLAATAAVATASGGSGGPAAWLTVSVGALVLVAAAAALVLVTAARAATPDEAPVGPQRPSGTVVVAGVVLALPVLPLLAVAGLLPRPVGAVVDVVAVVVLLAVGAVVERGPGRVPATPALATGAAAAAAVVGIQAVPLALTGVAQGGVFLAVATVLAVLARGTRRHGVLLAAGVFGAIGLLQALGRDLPLDVVVDGLAPDRATLLGMAVVAVLVIATAATLLAALGRLGHLGTRNRSAAATAVLGLVGLYGAAGLVVTVALAISPTRSGFLVGHVLVTISWTALALVLLVRGPRSEAVSLPRVLGGVLVVAAVAKLILFDLVTLDGLARVAVFLGAGVVLLVAGTRYARWVTAGAGDAEGALSEGPGTLADHE